MSEKLTDEEMRRIRLDYAKTLNWRSMDDQWQQRWAILVLSDEKLESKFFDLLISFFPNRGDGISPPIELLAAIAGRQPRAVMNHTTRLHEKGWLPRTSGCGRGNTTVYALSVPKRTERELATLLGIKVQQDAPFNGKRCILTTEKVQQDAHPLFSFLKETSSSAVRSKKNGGMNGRHHPIAETMKRKMPQGDTEDYPDDFKAWLKAYQGAMFKAGGRAAINAHHLKAPESFAVWQKLDEAHRGAAVRFIASHREDAKEYMHAGPRYLGQTVQSYLDKEEVLSQEADDKRRYVLKTLVDFINGQRSWTQGLIDKWGTPPPDPSSRVPPDLWREAKTLAELETAKGRPNAA